MTEKQLKNIITRTKKLRGELIQQASKWTKENDKSPGQVHHSCIDAMVCASAEMQDAIGYLETICS